MPQTESKQSGTIQFATPQISRVSDAVVNFNIEKVKAHDEKVDINDKQVLINDDGQKEGTGASTAKEDCALFCATGKPLFPGGFPVPAITDQVAPGQQ